MTPFFCETRGGRGRGRRSLELTGCVSRLGNFALKDKRVFSAEAVFQLYPVY